MSLNLHAALYFVDMGYPVLPCVPETMTLLPGFDVRRATLRKKVVYQWWTEYPTANIALRCDDLCVFDVATRDELKIVRHLYPPTQKIPDGGYQVFFHKPIRKRPPKGLGIKSGCRAFVVVGPSYLPSGLLQWLIPIGPVATLPDFVSLEIALSGKLNIHIAEEDETLEE